MPDHRRITIDNHVYDVEFEYFAEDPSVGKDAEYHIIDKPDFLTDGEVIEELELLKQVEEDEAELDLAEDDYYHW